MSEMILQSEGLFSITGVSNIFLDQYMAEANGEFVKVYLYLLRCMNDPSKKCTVSAIADFFDHTEKDILRALTYWEKKNVLHIEYTDGKPVGIKLLPLGALSDTPVSMPVAPAPVSIPEEKAKPSTPTRREYSADEIEGYRKNPDVSELFFVIEAYLRTPITYEQINTVLFWYDSLGLPIELIDYLVEYCVNKGHHSFRYMDKIALDWHENGIHTVEAAREDAERHNKENYSVMKALGISGRDLAQSEKNFIAKWTNEWKFELPIIVEACRRTIEATHQASFNYTDKVLETWLKNGVKNMDDILRLDEEFTKNKKITINTTQPRKYNRFVDGFESRDNNYDELERLLVHRPV